MSLHNFFREEKNLTLLEQKQMNQCYDWFLKLKLEYQERVDNLEKRIPRKTNPFSICESKIELENCRYRLKFYKDTMKFIDDRLKNKEDLGYILEFVNCMSRKQVYESEKMDTQ